MFRAIGWVLAAHACAGCDDGTDSPRPLRDAGIHPGSGDGAPGSSDSSPRVEDAASPSMGEQTEQRDGSTEICDGGLVAHVDPTAGAPPARCMAPCVWNLIKNCLPEGECGADNDWKRVPDPPGGWFRGGYGYTVYVHGRLCYGFRYSSVPPYNSFPTWAYTDANGQTVAQGFGGMQGGEGLKGSIVCGAVCKFHGSGGTYFAPCDGGAEATSYPDSSICRVQQARCAADSSEGFGVDPTRPECEPWRGLR